MTTPEIEIEPKSEALKRLEAQELKFQTVEKEIADMRAWIQRNAERLAPYEWHIIGLAVNFFSFQRAEGQQGEIAWAFGNGGWKREKDSYTCGAIHWVKEFDGAELKIHEAEIVKLNPIEEVKL